MTYRHWFALAGLLVVLLGAGCGSSGRDRVSINMREFSFSPDGFTVPAGAEVTITLNNLGALDHNFHIMESGSEVEDKWEEGDEANALLNQEVIDGGDSVEITFIAPEKPGVYQFLCSVPAHFQQGMAGSMTVTEP